MHYSLTSAKPSSNSQSVHYVLYVCCKTPAEIQQMAQLLSRYPAHHTTTLVKKRQNSTRLRNQAQWRIGDLSVVFDVLLKLNGRSAEQYTKQDPELWQIINDLRRTSHRNMIYEPVDVLAPTACGNRQVSDAVNKQFSGLQALWVNLPRIDPQQAGYADFFYKLCLMCRYGQRHYAQLCHQTLQGNFFRTQRYHEVTLATALLDDYRRSWTVYFWGGKHHTHTVSQVLKQFARLGSSQRNLENLMNLLNEGLRQSEERINPTGSLARRIQFLESLTQSPHANLFQATHGGERPQTTPAQSTTAGWDIFGMSRFF